MRKNEKPPVPKKSVSQICANDQPTAKTPPYSPKHHIHSTQFFNILLFIQNTTTMPKTKPTDSGSSSSDDGSNYSNNDRDESSHDHHRVYEDVEELKAAGEWKPGRGQLLGGIVREGKAKYMVVQLEKCDHRDFRFHCDPCDVLLKANSVNAHKNICLGVKKNRKKMKKKWKEAKKRLRQEAKKREAKENKKRKHQDGGGTDDERPWKKPKSKGTAARRTARREAGAARQNSDTPPAAAGLPSSDDEDDEEERYIQWGHHLLPQTEYDEVSTYWREEVRDLQATQGEGKSEEYPGDKVQVTVHRVSPTMSVQQLYTVELILPVELLVADAGDNLYWIPHGRFMFLAVRDEDYENVYHVLPWHRYPSADAFLGYQLYHQRLRRDPRLRNRQPPPPAPHTNGGRAILSVRPNLSPGITWGQKIDRRRS
eukprot:scaffold35677_cov76-Cyclotella_meneghiniana.AAC.1